MESFQMQTYPESVPENGSWISARGPYRDCIAAWCKLNPSLRSPDTRNQWSPLRDGNANVVMLELKQGNQVRRHDFNSAAELSNHLLNTSSHVDGALPANRIYIMEGLAADYNAALGNHFFMDPKFFMEQERTTAFGLSHQGSQQIQSLPSLADPQKLFAMKYYELRDFGTITTFSMWCARTSRNISVTRNTRPDLQEFEFEPIGIIRRRCSFWFKRYDNNNWDCK
jgi:hypothetical protein